MKTIFSFFVVTLFTLFFVSCSVKDNPVTQENSQSSLDGQNTNFTLITGINYDNGFEQVVIAFETFTCTGYSTSRWRYFTTPDVSGNFLVNVELYMGWVGGSSSDEIGGFVIKRSSDNQSVLNDYLNGNTSYSGSNSKSINIYLQPNTNYKIQMYTTVAPEDKGKKID